MNHDDRFASPEELLAHAGWVRALARRLAGGDAGLADDLVQDTYLAALQRPPRRDRSLKPWLNTVVRNFMRERGRSEQHRRQREQIQPEPNLPTPDVLLEKLSTQEQVVAAVRRLREPYRSTVLLHYFEGLLLSEIAEQQGLAAATVRQRLKRALEQLRTQLDSAYGGDRQAWIAAVSTWLGEPFTSLTTGGLTAGFITGVIAMSVPLKIALGISAIVGVWLSLDWIDREPRPEPEFQVRQQVEPIPMPRVVSEDLERKDLNESANQVESTSEDVAGVTIHQPAVLGICEVHLRLVDEEERPISGVEVQGPDFVENGELHAVSDAAGKVKFEVPMTAEASSAYFIFKKKGFAHSSIFPALEVDAVKHLGDTVLEYGSEIYGSVVDANDHPVAGAKVWITKAESLILKNKKNLRLHGFGNRRGAIETDAEGTFSIEGIPLGNWRVWSFKTGYQHAWSGSVRLKAGQPVNLKPLELSVMDARDQIAGEVVDADGIPLERVQIGIPGKPDIAYTDADGKFHFVVKNRRPHDVRARLQNSVWRGTTVRDVKTGTLDLRIQLQAAPQIELKVRDPEGKPVDDFVLRVYENNGGTYYRPLLQFGQQTSIALPDVSFFVNVQAQGFTPHEIGPFEPESFRGPLELTITPSLGIRGLIRAAGTPVANADVKAYGAMGNGEAVKILDEFHSKLGTYPQGVAESNAEGEFHLFLGESAFVYLQIQLPGYAVEVVGPLAYEPTEGISGVQVELKKGGTIQGQVRLADNADPNGQPVAIESLGHWPRMTRANADGFYQFEHVPAGDWYVRLTEHDAAIDFGTPAYVSTEGEAPTPNCFVTEGEITNHDIFEVSSQPISITGSFTLDGHSTEGWTAQLWTDIRGLPYQLYGEPVPLEGNAFELVVEQPDVYHLIVSSPGSSLGLNGLIFRDRLTLRAGETELNWEHRVSCGSVIGRIGEENRARKGMFFLHAEDGAIESGSMLQVDSSGRFQVDVFPAGPVKIKWVQSFDDFNDPSTWKTIAEKEVLIGETSRLDLP